MKKKYLKYFIFLMVSFLSIGLFIGKVNAAGEICTYHTKNLGASRLYSVYAGKYGTSHRFYKIQVIDKNNNAHTGFCLGPGMPLSTTTDLRAMDCSQISANSSMIYRAKQAADFCSGFKCDNTSSYKYIVAQVYIWGENESTAVRAACEFRTNSIKNGANASFDASKLQLLCPKGLPFDMDSVSGGYVESLHRKMTPAEKEYYQIAMDTSDFYNGIKNVKQVSADSSYTCLQSSDRKSQPILVRNSNYKKCEDNPKYTCYNKDLNKSIDITECVTSCQNKGGTLTSCKKTCTDEKCPETLTTKYVCPDDSDKPGEDITKCVNETGNFDGCVEQYCMENKKICKGVAYKYTGSTPQCTDDGLGKVWTFQQYTDGKATTGLSGSEKGYGELKKTIAPYGVIYCREIEALVKLPGALSKSIQLGGYFVWPTYKDPLEVSSIRFGSQYPLSFQGTMECRYQVAPNVSKNDDVNCNNNAAGDYEDKYNDLITAATNQKTGTMIQDKISVAYEEKKLENYLGVTSDKRNTHTVESIRTYTAKDKVTTKSCTPVPTNKDTGSTSETVIKDDFVLYTKEEPIYLLRDNTNTTINPNVWIESDWEGFVKNADDLNDNLKKVKKKFNFANVDLSKKGLQSYTMQYEITSGVDSEPVVSWSDTYTGWILVVDTFPPDQTTSDSSITETECVTREEAIDNNCLTETKGDCASTYFGRLEEWKVANYDYWNAKYNSAMSSCKKQTHQSCKTYTKPDGTTGKSCKQKQNDEGYCKANNKTVQEMDKRRSHWSETVKDQITTMENNFKTYADAYFNVVETYLSIWQISYDQTLANCNGDGKNCFYNFQTGATLKYTDEENTNYKNYGAEFSLKKETEIQYTCTNPTGYCGDAPLTPLYPNVLNDDKSYNHIYTDWQKALYGDTSYSKLISEMTPSYVSGKINTINSSVSRITTNEIFYSIPERELYSYIEKNGTTNYSKSPIANYIPIGFGVLPTSYGNIPGKEYDTILKNIVVGNDGEANRNIDSILAEYRILAEYTCHYKVTNVDEPLECPPGTLHAGWRLDLETISRLEGRDVSFEEAVEKYCDCPPPPPTCDGECYYCTDVNTGAKIDITSCVKINGGNISKCKNEQDECNPNIKRYFCPKDSDYPDKEITSCVQRGNSQAICEKTYCTKGTGNRLFVYRTIDLKNPFPSIDADETIKNPSYKDFFNLDVIGRKPGSNWFSGYLDDYTKENNYVKTKIIHNRNVDDYEVYDKKPLYHIELDRSTILKIREYNKNQQKSGGYADFKLTCIQDEANKYVGMACRSSFLHSDISGLVQNASKSQCGSARNSNDLIKCLYQDEELGAS